MPPRRGGQAKSSNPQPPQPTVQDTRPHHPPCCYIHSDDKDEGAGPVVLADPVPALPAIVPHNPRQTEQELEYINPEAYTESDGDDEPGEVPIPQVRGPHSADFSQDTQCSTTNTVDPLNSIQMMTECAKDVHHFFEKKKEESTTCIPCRYVVNYMGIDDTNDWCRDWKASDPEKFPNHTYIYSLRTANSGLCGHIEKYHILFLKQPTTH
jgi:hypothetical protein